MASTSVASDGIVREVLTKDNYDNWSVLVRNYLLGRGLWDVVASTSDIDVKNKDEDKNWKKENAKALHIIQLSCGSEVLTQIRKLQTAKEAWNHLSATFSTNLKANADIEQGVADDSLLDNRPLHRYVESGKWNDAKAFINKDNTAIFSTNSSGRTILHVAVIAGHVDIVETLVKEGKDKLVKMQDNRDYTALAVAADLTGNTKIAKCLVERKGKQDNQDLLTMRTKDGEIPVLLAAAKGHKQMTRYLYSKTPLDELVDKNSPNGVLLLTRCITAEIFDVALSLLQSSPGLPLTHESESLRPLYALAHMPSLFPSGNRFGRPQQFLYNVLRLEKKLRDSYGITIEIVSHVAQDEEPHKTSFAGRFYGRLLNVQLVKLLGRLLVFVYVLFQNSILLKFSSEIREIYDQKVTHRLVLEILSCMCRRISDYKESELQEASAYDAMLQAAKLGIIEFIDAMRKANSDLLWAIDNNKRGIFSHAILNRRKDVFDLILGTNGRKEIIKSRPDAFDNNLLHLAGHLGPSSYLDRRSGAALQMQREIQWFKAVKGIVHPKCKEAKNADGKTPRELFSESHKRLVKAGEEWAKDTVRSFAIVGTLIITAMFSAAFNVPGGNKDGTPIFLHNKKFTAFIIADAIGLFSSSTSILVFIRILTSRFAEKDFLYNLPSKLVFGLFFLLLSVLSMLIAFCLALSIMLKENKWVQRGAISLASIPLVIFVPSQVHLLFEILKSTGRSYMFSSTKKENNVSISSSGRGSSVCGFGFGSGNCMCG